MKEDGVDRMWWLWPGVSFHRVRSFERGCKPTRAREKERRAEGEAEREGGRRRGGRQSEMARRELQLGGKHIIINEAERVAAADSHVRTGVAISPLYHALPRRTVLYHN